MTTDPQTDPLVGRRFGKEGVFHVRRRLGEGGMGFVYEAWDEKRDKPRAIKFLNPASVTAPDIPERFRREGRRFAEVRHENLVRIHGLGREDGFFYIVSEFVEGMTLHDRIYAEPPVTLAEALDICRQIARGVEALHAARIVHRDLKPANVMIRPDGVVKVLDFGLAKFLDDSTALTRVGTFLGTVGYSAPEQVAGKDIDLRADIFTLGIILYRLASGSRAFDGRDSEAILRATVKGTPTPLIELDDSLPPVLDALVRKMLEKRPARRPESMTEIIAVLDALIDGREDELPESSAGRPTTKRRGLWPFGKR